tara:strand:+ start:496 stop:708 length:213 start_codon:yes stop_codon:yes gene_type:complete
MYRDNDTGIIMTGGVDDIWQDTITRQLIIVDYKSQAKNGRVDKKVILRIHFTRPIKLNGLLCLFALGDGF